MSNIKAEIGNLASGLLRRTIKGSLPHSTLQSPALKQLQGGDFSDATIDAVVAELTRHIQTSVEQVQNNPYYGKPTAIAKSLIGAPIMTVYGPGSVSVGMITKVAAYSGKGDESLVVQDAPFTVYNDEPGTIGLWEKGNNKAACVAAHELGGHGYIALWGVANGEQKLGMTETVERFGFDQLIGNSVYEPKSQLIMPIPYKHASTLAVRSLDKKKGGDGCLGIYEAKKA